MSTTTKQQPRSVTTCSCSCVLVPLLIFLFHGYITDAFTIFPITITPRTTTTTTPRTRTSSFTKHKLSQHIHTSYQPRHRHRSSRQSKNQHESFSTMLHMNWFTKGAASSLPSSPKSKSKKDNKTKKIQHESQKITILEKIGSGSYGTVHLCKFAFVTDTNNNDIEGQGQGQGQGQEQEQEQEQLYVAKRAWTLAELIQFSEAQPPSLKKEEVQQDAKAKATKKDKLKQERKQLEERSKRCTQYINVEQHCLEKIRDQEKEQNSRKDDDCHDDDDEEGSTKEVRLPRLPNVIGRFYDDGINCNGDGNENGDGKHEWLVFDLITSNNSDKKAARTLNHVMYLDWKDQHHDDTDTDTANSSISSTNPNPSEQKQTQDQHQHHHLFMIQKELNMDVSSTFDDTLDMVFKLLLQSLVQIHKYNIVHRDIKPDNLLVDGNTKSLVLIDFGSAADMDPSTSLFSYGKRVGFEDTIAAVSPIYAAPETFIKLGAQALAFDVFSVGLIFCQLLFNLLDERTDAAFRQQLEEVQYDLDLWLERELEATLRPAGFEDGMLYLGSRPGLWRLLKDMLYPKPSRRISSVDALKTFQKIMEKYLASESLDETSDVAVIGRKEIDGPYFDSVITSLDSCGFPPDSIDSVGMNNEFLTDDVLSDTSSTSDSDSRFVVPRPLHFIATFERGESLGLILSEVEIDEDEEDDNDDDDEGFITSNEDWERSTQGAQKGEVFVRKIVKGGQADKIGIIEIGDRLVGVQEFPFFNGGFGMFLNFLDRVPQSAKTVKVHFDRRSNILKSIDQTSSSNDEVKVVSQGAWSTRGRRKQNEDEFILQEIHDESGTHSFLVAGVFDGHGGDSASKTASQLLPSLLSTELKSGGLVSLPESLKSAWDITCETYRDGCSIYGACVADYDPREGILVAGTGSKDLVAGTTAAVAAFSINQNPGINELNVLNCGDSRTLLVGKPVDPNLKSYLHFTSQDHSPSCRAEAERLQAGKQAGLDYSEPQCSVNRWTLQIGDYRYAVSRSLEGELATSKGIVSDADMSTIDLNNLKKERSSGMMIIASDGIFEVLDNEQVAREAVKMRENGSTAKDTAKLICGMALDKNTSDNVSAVVVFFS